MEPAGDAERWKLRSERKAAAECVRSQPKAGGVLGGSAPCSHTHTRSTGCLEWVKRQLFRVGEDWYFLFILGVLMALISFMMDLLISRLYEAHRWLYQEIGDVLVLKYLSWTIYPIVMATFSTGFSQSITPHSGGSGIPELKTILTGVVLEDYLAIKNFGAKVVGLTCTLAAGSTVFLGKVGSCIHLSAMAAVYLGKMRTSVMKEYEVGHPLPCRTSSSRTRCWWRHKPSGWPRCSEHPLVVRTPLPHPIPPGHPQIPLLRPFRLLPLCFPGVLFSIEVMSSHFAVPAPFWGVSGGVPTFPLPISGAAIGRLLGETVALLFPQGIHSEGALHPIIPSGYALAGAAAFSGAVTHSISTALLVCEATGHLGHALPVTMAVLVANAVAQKHQPSFYEGTIIVKKLPYLPRIRSRHMA
uniref:Uncharacterized protein n=1 Tax=Amazona collaria TaxID=241587 RepID=A0A8B9IZ62_9PSIT